MFWQFAGFPSAASFPSSNRSISQSDPAPSYQEVVSDLDNSDLNGTKPKQDETPPPPDYSEVVTALTAPAAPPFDSTDHM